MDELKLSTYRCGSDRARGECLRIGAVRYLPRGVKKENYAKENYLDVWLPTVAPSRELLAEVKELDLSDPKNRDKFFARYEREMKNNTDARQSILLLASIAARTPVAIGCYCEDEGRCHRSVLKKLITAASRGQWA